MKTEEIKRWELVEFKRKRYLRDRAKNDGLLVEIHESQMVTEYKLFIVIYCTMSDFNLKMYSSYSLFDEQSGLYVYYFKKRELDKWYTLFQ